MEDNEITKGEVSDWQPITNKCDLAVLGKFGEELSECTTAIFRCIIQGMMESEPKTGKVNKIWLEEEIADVRALLTFAEQRFDLNLARIAKRAEMKRSYKRPWFKSLAKLDTELRSMGNGIVPIAQPVTMPDD